MNNDTWNSMVHALVGGCIRGMKQVGRELNEAKPAAYEPVDDRLMFDAGILLVATVIEANPDYRDPKQFGKAADQVQRHLSRRLKEVRRQREATGMSALRQHIETTLT